MRKESGKKRARVSVCVYVNVSGVRCECVPVCQVCMYVCGWVGVAAGNQAGMNFVSWGYWGSDFISIDYH